MTQGHYVSWPAGAVCPCHHDIQSWLMFTAKNPADHGWEPRLKTNLSAL